MTPPVSPKSASLTLPRYPGLEKVSSRRSGEGVRSWRKADKFLLFILGSLLLVGLMFAHAAVRTEANLPRLQEEGKIVKHLGITDLCLSTEAAYLRHPSQADWHSPFQTHPLALEYFPTGAIVTPPK